ncbi:hypothetical protein SAMN05428964_106117 [Thalassospira xiamenensis]|uniref:Uncharacterized protein n=1 Tax=Thalassospira xiamenensis TaxID=220697 RepID=A0A285TWJ1_9PROT|nr:hypothetical protein SAMN05428964_106117 [Thalassospira xiamenensis]
MTCLLLAYRGHLTYLRTKLRLNPFIRTALHVINGATP